MKNQLAGTAFPIEVLQKPRDAFGYLLGLDATGDGVCSCWRRKKWRIFAKKWCRSHRRDSLGNSLGRTLSFSQHTTQQGRFPIGKALHVQNIFYYNCKISLCMRKCGITNAKMHQCEMIFPQTQIVHCWKLELAGNNCDKVSSKWKGCLHKCEWISLGQEKVHHKRIIFNEETMIANWKVLFCLETIWWISRTRGEGGSWGNNPMH